MPFLPKNIRNIFENISIFYPLFYTSNPKFVVSQYINHVHGFRPVYIPAVGFYISSSLNHYDLISKPPCEYNALRKDILNTCICANIEIQYKTCLSLRILAKMIRACRTFNFENVDNDNETTMPDLSMSKIIYCPSLLDVDSLNASDINKVKIELIIIRWNKVLQRLRVYRSIW